MVVIDASFLVAIEKGEDRANRLHSDLRSSTRAIRAPAAVWMAYLSGFPPGDRDEARKTLEAGTRFEPFTRRLADEAARLQHELLEPGQTLGWHDLQVATTALHYDEPVVSTDERFEPVPGLAVLPH